VLGDFLRISEHLDKGSSCSDLSRVTQITLLRSCEGAHDQSAGGPFSVRSVRVTTLVWGGEGEVLAACDAFYASPNSLWGSVLAIVSMPFARAVLHPLKREGAGLIFSESAEGQGEVSFVPHEVLEQATQGRVKLSSYWFRKHPDSDFR